MKKGDWYFDGYESRSSLGSDGRSHNKLVYTGAYYGFAKGYNARVLKITYAGLTFFYLACWFLSAASSSAAARVPYIGMPMMVSLFPGIYLLIGTCCFLPAKAEMTARVYYSSLRRMHRSLMVIVPLLAISSAGCIFYCVFGRGIPASRELGYVCFILFAFCGTLVEFILLRKRPAVIVRDPDSNRIDG